jgi:hypothetical protein
VLPDGCAVERLRSRAVQRCCAALALRGGGIVALPLRMLRIRIAGARRRVAVAPRRRVATSKGPWRSWAVTSCIARKAGAQWPRRVYIHSSCRACAQQGRDGAGRVHVYVRGCCGSAPSRSPASMSDPWGNPSTSPLPRGHQKPHGGIGAIAPADGYRSCQPTPSRTGAPSSRACRSCGTGKKSSRLARGGDNFPKGAAGGQGGRSAGILPP